MTGTVLYDGKRSTAQTCAEPRTATRCASAEASHALHGLVAIANGPDYCLCGRTWPCEGRTT